MSQDNRSYGPGQGPWMSPPMPGQGPATAPHWGQQPGYGYPAQAPAYQGMPQRAQSSSILPRDRFLKGLLIGAAATYLLTNEQVQRTAIKGVVQAWSLLQGGLEEVKERFGDAQAEIHHATQRPDSD
jgi:hypothetical protein